VYVCAVVFYLGSVLSPSCCPGNVFAESFPRECIYRAIAPGTCFPSRGHGNVFSEPLPREFFCVFVPKQR
jgi:hypothetical protein